MRIGFLGLGTVGEPVANNLRKAGHELTVWNRSRPRADHIVSKGGAFAKAPKACAQGKDLVFTCLSDEKALDAVLDGPEGALAGLKQGDVLVAGGPSSARERARPALRAVSARIFELEDPVQAALMKLCVNAVGGAMIAGFGEALALGASGGLPIWKLVEVIQASPFHSPLFLVKGELVERTDWAPRFAIALAEKDQRLAQEAAADQGAKMPINEAVRRLFADAVESGRGEKDIAAVADLFFDWAKAKR